MDNPVRDHMVTIASRALPDSDLVVPEGFSVRCMLPRQSGSDHHREPQRREGAALVVGRERLDDSITEARCFRSVGVHSMKDATSSTNPGCCDAL
jgi:hypothetical protein